MSTNRLPFSNERPKMNVEMNAWSIICPSAVEDTAVAVAVAVVVTFVASLVAEEESLDTAVDSYSFEVVESAVR